MGLNSPSVDLDAHRTSGARGLAEVTKRAVFALLPTQTTFKKDRIFHKDNSDPSLPPGPARSPEQVHKISTLRGAAIGIENVAMTVMAAGAADALGAPVPILTPRDALLAGIPYVGGLVLGSIARRIAR
jgi:hypothetical protein